MTYSPIQGFTYVEAFQGGIFGILDYAQIPDETSAKLEHAFTTIIIFITRL